VAAEGRKDLHEGLLERFILPAGGEALHLPTRASWAIQEPTVPSQWWHRRAMIIPLTSWLVQRGVHPQPGPTLCKGFLLLIARSAIRVAPTGIASPAIQRRATMAGDLRRFVVRSIWACSVSKQKGLFMAQTSSHAAWPGWSFPAAKTLGLPHR